MLGTIPCVYNNYLHPIDDKMYDYMHDQQGTRQILGTGTHTLRKGNFKSTLIGVL